MMSRTVRFSCRYFKLIYIVAGILLSNEEVCETVDQIQIATRVEVKEKMHQKTAKKVQRLAIEEDKTTVKNFWLRKFDLFQMANKIKCRIRPNWCAFNIWTIPNYFIEYSTSLLCRKFAINSDCDVIYK